MGSLGYNVALHRTLAFGFGAFVAAISGILFVWWNNQIAPGSIDLGAIIDLLIIAVIGGLFRLEGAWVGAFVFVILNNYTRDIPLVHYVGISEERFHTLIGVAFLLIVLLNPGGLIGIWEWFRKRMSRRLGPKPRSPEPIPSPAGPGAGI
jgi:branched-chain amino acid transport system permease protein